MRERLVHPKDKIEKTEQGGVVYKIPCQNCENSYIGETGRLFKTRLDEHRKEAEMESKQRKFTRSERIEAEGTLYKSAITDHVMRTNHIIDWEGAEVLDHESFVRSRQVRESIWIKRNTPAVLNRDQGAYQLPQIYNQVIAAPPSGDRKVQKRASLQ